MTMFCFPKTVKNNTVIRLRTCFDPQTSQDTFNQTSQVNLLVVLCRQVNAVLVSSGCQVALQPLDLLRVFLRRHKNKSVFSPQDVKVLSTFLDTQRVGPTLMSVLLVSFWLTSGLFMMFLALLAYSSVLRVSCTTTQNVPDRESKSSTV